MIIRYILSVLTVGCALTLPGMAVSRAFDRRTPSGRPLSLRIVSSVIISLSLIFLFSFLLGELPLPLILKRIAAGSLIPIAALFLWKQPAAPASDRPRKRLPFFLFAGIALLAVVWLAVIPLQSYPGNLPLGMGDIPEYYVLAKNIHSERGFTTDYFICDFWTGPRLGIEEIIDSPPTSGRRPLVPYLTGYFFHLLGVDYHLINIMASFLAAIVPLIFYSFLSRYSLRKDGFVSRDRDLLYQFLSLLVCLIPTHFVLFALGTITLFELFPFFTLITLITAEDRPTGLSLLAAALSAGLTTVSRPEGTILVFFIFLIYLLPAGLKAIMGRGRTGRAPVVAASVLAGVLLLNLPLFFIRYGPDSGQLWYRTLSYRPETERFEPLYPRWSEFNFALARENFADRPDIENVINPKAFSEIALHPIAFGKWLLREMTLKLIFPFTSLYAKGTGGAAPIVSGAVIILLVLTAILGPARRIVLLLCLYALGFSLLTPTFYDRQVIAISLPVLAAFCLTLDRIAERTGLLKALRLSPGRRTGPEDRILGAPVLVLASLTLLALIALQSVNLVEFLARPENRKYEPAIRIIENRTERSSVVVSDYPQLINLMTGRVGLGSTNLLDLLNPNLERYRPDYVLITDCRFNRSYSRLEDGKNRPARNYLIRNFTLVEQDPENRILLFRRRPGEGRPGS